MDTLSPSSSLTDMREAVTVEGLQNPALSRLGRHKVALTRSHSARLRGAEEVDVPEFSTLGRATKERRSLFRRDSKRASANFLSEPELLHKSLGSLSVSKRESVRDLTSQLAMTRRSFNPVSDPSRDDLNRANLLGALEKMVGDQPPLQPLFSPKDFSLLLKLNQVLKSHKKTKDIEVLLEYMARALVIQVVEIPESFNEPIQALLNSDSREDNQLGRSIISRKLSWEQMDQLRLHRDKKLRPLAQLIDRRAEFFCVDDVSEERLREIADDPTKINNIGLNELNEMRRKAIAEKMPKAAPVVERAGYLEHTEQLRTDLKSLNGSNSRSVARLIENIKTSLTSGVIARKCKEGSINEKTIYMMIELSKAVEGGVYFHTTDLPLLAKLHQAKTKTENSLLLYTLMAQLAQCVVVELLEDSDPIFQFAVKELSESDEASDKAIGKALAEKRINFYDLETMRLKGGFVKKLAEIIIARRSYISEDSCTAERLQCVMAQPEILNDVIGDKKSMTQFMREFENQFDTEIMLGSLELCEIRGRFQTMLASTHMGDELKLRNEVAVALNLAEGVKEHLMPQCLKDKLAEIHSLPD